MDRWFGRTKAWSIGIAIGIATSFLAGCASVPPETVELSHTIGRDLGEIHRSHRELAQLHFANVKEDVNEFIDDTYRPALIALTAEEASLVPNITTILERDPGRLPTYLGAFLNQVDPLVETKRRELLTPIEDQERELLADINAAHSNVQAANAVISGHLASIRSVHEAQSQALEAVGLSNMRERIATTTADVSDGVARLNARGLEISSEIDDAARQIEAFNEAIAEASAVIGRSRASERDN